MTGKLFLFIIVISFSQSINSLTVVSPLTTGWLSAHNLTDKLEIIALFLGKPYLQAVFHLQTSDGHNYL